MRELNLNERGLIVGLIFGCKFQSGHDMQPTLWGCLPSALSLELRKHIDYELHMNSDRFWGARGTGCTFREFLDVTVRLSMRHSGGWRRAEWPGLRRLERELDKLIKRLSKRSVPRLRLDGKKLQRELRLNGYLTKRVDGILMGRIFNVDIFNVVSRKTIGLRQVSMRFFKPRSRPLDRQWKAVIEVPPNVKSWKKERLEYRIVRLVRNITELRETITETEKLAGLARWGGTR